MAVKTTIDRKKVWRLYRQGFKPGQIASKLNIHRNSAMRIINQIEEIQKEKGGDLTVNLPDFANFEESATTDNGENIVADSSMTQN